MNKIIIYVEDIESAPETLNEVARLIENGYYSGYEPSFEIETEND